MASSLSPESLVVSFFLRLWLSWLLLFCSLSRCLILAWLSHPIIALKIIKIICPAFSLCRVHVVDVCITLPCWFFLRPFICFPVAVSLCPFPSFYPFLSLSLPSFVVFVLTLFLFLSLSLSPSMYCLCRFCFCLFEFSVCTTVCRFRSPRINTKH